jgi:hypothetical protein
MKPLICFLFISQISIAQIQLNKPEITIPFALFAGMCDGVSQTLYSHYYAFETKFPEANPQYWNPYHSWTNKYKNGDPAQGPKFIGSTTVFVSMTDAFHLLRTLNKLNLVTLGALEFSEKRTWQEYVIDLILYSAVYSVGFTLTYDIIFK